MKRLKVPGNRLNESKEGCSKSSKQIASRSAPQNPPRARPTASDISAGVVPPIATRGNAGDVGIGHPQCTAATQKDECKERTAFAYRALHPASANEMIDNMEWQREEVIGSVEKIQEELFRKRREVAMLERQLAVAEARENSKAVVGNRSKWTGAGLSSGMWPEDEGLNPDGEPWLWRRHLVKQLSTRRKSRQIEHPPASALRAPVTTLESQPLRRPITRHFLATSQHHAPHPTRQASAAPRSSGAVQREAAPRKTGAEPRKTKTIEVRAEASSAGQGVEKVSSKRVKCGLAPGKRSSDGIRGKRRAVVGLMRIAALEGATPERKRKKGRSDVEYPPWMWGHEDDHRANEFVRMQRTTPGNVNHRDLTMLHHFVGEKGKDLTYARQQLVNREFLIQWSDENCPFCPGGHRNTPDFSWEASSSRQRRSVSRLVASSMDVRRAGGAGIWNQESDISDTRRQSSTAFIASMLGGCSHIARLSRVIAESFSRSVGADEVLTGATILLWNIPPACMTRRTTKRVLRTRSPLASNECISGKALAEWAVLLQQQTMGRAIAVCSDRDALKTFGESVQRFVSEAAGKTEAMKFLCPDNNCLQRFPTEEKVTSHFVQFHSDLKICPVCRSSWGGKPRLRQHMAWVSKKPWNPELVRVAAVSETADMWKLSVDLAVVPGDEKSPCWESLRSLPNLAAIAVVGGDPDLQFDALTVGRFRGLVEIGKSGVRIAFRRGSTRHTRQRFYILVHV
mmetsp:Transcript_32770/g.63205  ORF Transcript_32770/g.63205 Transcript_32770/m.63205 type:complete len:740 (-) Transcript_32770:939-3158(-)